MSVYYNIGNNSSQISLLEMDNKVCNYITNSGFLDFINSKGAAVINMGENEKGD